MPHLDYETPPPDPDRHVLAWILGSVAVIVIIFCIVIMLKMLLMMMR